MMSLTIVVPLFNEETVILHTINRLLSLKEKMPEYATELIFIDDGSTDSSLEILEIEALKDPSIKIVSFSRNFGHQAAISAGIKKSQGDYVAIIDADMQDPPEEIPNMLLKSKEGFDIVYGKRKLRMGESKYKVLSASIFYKIFQAFSYIDMPEETGDFRIINRRVVEAFNALNEKEKFIRGIFAWLGYKSYAYEYVREKRHSGSTKYPFKKMLNFAINGLISFSNKPLKLVTRLGFVIFVFTLITGSITAVLRIFMLVEIPYLTSIMLLIAFFGSIQIFILGIIGEYVGKVFEQVKDRPDFIISKEINL
jgi:polyisoprenyl-phosphate glycosyltransferase